MSHEALAALPPPVRRMIQRQPRKAIGDLVDRLETVTKH